MANGATLDQAKRRLAVVIGGSMAGLWAARVLGRALLPGHPKPAQPPHRPTAIAHTP